MPKAFDNEEVVQHVGHEMLDISSADGGGMVLWPLEAAIAFHAAPCEHLLITPCASRVSR